MHRSTDSGFIIPPVGGGIGYFERDTASESADLFTALRSLMRRVMSIFL